MVPQPRRTGLRLLRGGVRHRRYERQGCRQCAIGNYHASPNPMIRRAIIHLPLVPAESGDAYAVSRQRTTTGEKFESSVSIGPRLLGLMVRRRAIAGAACVHLASMRAVSNHGSRFGLAAILRDALAVARRRRAWTRLRLGLLRMRSEW